MSIRTPALCLARARVGSAPPCRKSRCGARIATAKLLKHATMKIYNGYPHGMLTVHADVLNPDLLAFFRS
jgi:hypothetical protein